MGRDTTRARVCDSARKRGQFCTPESKNALQMEPWERAGVTHDEWVAARLHAAALLKAVDNGDPDAVSIVLKRAEPQDAPV